MGDFRNHKLAGMLEKQSRWRKEWSERFFVMDEELQTSGNELYKCLSVSANEREDCIRYFVSPPAFLEAGFVEVCCAQASGGLGFLLRTPPRKAEGKFTSQDKKKMERLFPLEVLPNIHASQPPCRFDCRGYSGHCGFLMPNLSWEQRKLAGHRPAVLYQAWT